MNTCCGYSLKVPHWGASNKYPQHIFSCRNMSWVLIRSASTKKVLTDGQTDGQTDPRWLRSYPDKHSGKVWKFSVAKYSSYPSIKKVWTYRWTDRQTPDDSYSNFTTNIYSDQVWKFWVTRKSIQVIAAQRKCGRTDRQSDGQTMW